MSGNNPFDPYVDKRVPAEKKKKDSNGILAATMAAVIAAAGTAGAYGLAKAWLEEPAPLIPQPVTADVANAVLDRSLPPAVVEGLAPEAQATQSAAAEQALRVAENTMQTARQHIELAAAQTVALEQQAQLLAAERISAHQLAEAAQVHGAEAAARVNQAQAHAQAVVAQAEHEVRDAREFVQQAVTERDLMQRQMQQMEAGMRDQQAAAAVYAGTPADVAARQVPVTEGHAKRQAPRVVGKGQPRKKHAHKSENAMDTVHAQMVAQAHQLVTGQAVTTFQQRDIGNVANAVALVTDNPRGNFVAQYPADVETLSMRAREEANKTGLSNAAANGGDAAQQMDLVKTRGNGRPSDAAYGQTRVEESTERRAMDFQLGEAERKKRASAALQFVADQRRATGNMLGPYDNPALGMDYHEPVHPHYDNVYSFKPGERSSKKAKRAAERPEKAPSRHRIRMPGFPHRIALRGKGLPGANQFLGIVPMQQTNGGKSFYSVTQLLPGTYDFGNDQE
jgi:hypothetical protein